MQQPKHKQKLTSSKIGVVPEQISPSGKASASGTNPGIHGYHRLNQQVLFDSLCQMLDVSIIDAALSLHAADPSILNKTQPPLNGNKDAVVLPLVENENNNSSKFPPWPDNDNCVLGFTYLLTLKTNAHILPPTQTTFPLSKIKSTVFLDVIQ